MLSILIAGVYESAQRYVSAAYVNGEIKKDILSGIHCCFYQR